MVTKYHEKLYDLVNFPTALNIMNRFNMGINKSQQIKLKFHNAQNNFPREH
jgi:hypothetical protein